ncbi:PAXIP1-associated glutamate-rich protein 1 [Onthophagus taurus]|uniref:PAXIP1-associated glutamate-rich protein 1 n=1 Tax=Onthophagus taurus TaxID=166361 RepID=UPI000C20F2CD|nr:uncharacterized protein LOC111429280 [Onthophagus taurus]
MSVQNLYKSDDDLNVDCSDEEYIDCKGPWQPPIDQVYKIYSALSKGELPELHWKSPGYKSATPEIQPNISSEEINEVKQEEDKTHFDFLEDVALPRLKIRKDGEDALKGSAKKKTTSLDSIINNMKRHKMLPQSQDP